MLRRMKERRQLRHQADGLYVALVAQARNPVFYAEMAVPDSFDGRFELVVLHVYALTRGLDGRGEAMAELSRMVMESMIDDMDRTLREIGVGDMSVGRKVKQMAAAFYGRASAYDRALAGNAEDLRASMIRNVYAGEGPGEEVVDRLAEYLRRALGAVVQSSDEDAIAGRIAFPLP